MRILLGGMILISAVFFAACETETIVEEHWYFDTDVDTDTGYDDHDCLIQQCRPTSRATCIAAGTLRETIDYCNPNDFECYCRDGKMSYPYLDYECESECLVNAIGGQDLCREDYEQLLDDCGDDTDCAILQFRYDTDVDWLSYPTERKIWW